MRFYEHQMQHRFYCGVDLHARTMYLCIVDPAGAILLHKNLPADPHAFREAIALYCDGLVVACECMFAWYWLADLCRPRAPSRDCRALAARRKGSCAFFFTMDSACRQ